MTSSALDRRRYRLGLRLFTGATRWLRWWIAAAVVLAVIGTPAAALIWPDSGVSLWTASISVLQWFAAATAGVWLFASFPGYIANGVTRREVTAAYLVFGALASAGLGLLAVAGFAAEHAVLAIVAEPLDTWGEALGKGARYLLVSPVYFFAGAAVVAVALRISKEAAFATTVFLLFPALVFAGTLSIEFFDYGLDSGAWATASWLGGGLAFLAVLVAIVIMSLRSIPLQPKQV